MEIDDLGLWKFTIEPTEGCEIQCPDCKEWSNHKEWRESEVYCELCGDHTAIACPKCDERFDHVWSKTFDVRQEKI